VPEGMVLDEELGRQRRVVIQRDRGGAVKLRIAEFPDGIRSILAVGAKQGQGGTFARVLVVGGVLGLVRLYRF